MKKLRIIIVDDHAVVREGFRSLLTNEPDMEVIAEAGDGVIAVQIVLELEPDVVVMDITMPVMNGIEATRKIVSANKNIKILALSMETDRRFVVDVLRSGAAGYVLKESTFFELSSAIRVVASGDTYLGPRISDLIIREYLQSIPYESAIFSESLTPKEKDTLKFIAEGKSSKEISSEFGISVKTVENHRHAIMKKLGLYSIAELTKYAIREGITSLR